VARFREDWNIGAGQFNHTGGRLQQPFHRAADIILTEIFGVAGEEIVCRYFSVNALRQKLGKSSVIVTSSLIWTLMHWDTNPGIFILGLLLGYLYYETKSLSVCILLHFIYNLTILTMPFYLLFRQTGDITFFSISICFGIICSPGRLVSLS